MNCMKRLFIIYVLTLPLACFSVLNAQNGNQLANGDSLDLPVIIQKVIDTYPSVKKAELDVEASNYKINLAQSAYYPNVDAAASYSHIGPVSKISLPSLGAFQLYPADNYSAALELNQQIYDFGKTAKSVDFENRSKELSQLSVEELKQKLSLSLLGNYYSIVYLQEAIRIKNEELKTLEEHLAFVEKKVATGSATQYEILTTKVKMSNIENQKTDLETNLKVLQSELNSFLGQPQPSFVVLKEKIYPPEILEDENSLREKALNQREELKIASQRNLMEEARLKIVDNQNNPVLNFFADGGLKNGYIPNLNKFTPNYAVGINFKLPILDGRRSKYNRALVETDKKELDQDTELTRRSIVNEVVENSADLKADLKKMQVARLQLHQAEQAYALAETNFKAGAITNLELLDSSTSLSESRLSVMKSEIDYTVSLLKLKISLGERIY